jgi:hypothetical protein
MILQFVEHVVDRSTFVVVVAAAVLAVVGLPRNQVRYRTILGLFAFFNLLAAFEWYVNFIMGPYYSHRTEYLDLVPLAIFLASSLLSLWETFTLRFFRRKGQIAHTSA